MSTDIKGDAKTQGGDLVGRDKIVKEQNNILAQLLELLHETNTKVTRSEGAIERLNEKFSEHCNQAGDARKMSEDNKAAIAMNKKKIDIHAVILSINTALILINLILTSWVIIALMEHIR